MTAQVALHRAVELQRLLGDPLDPANPVGEAAVVAADERGEVVADSERLLDGFGLGAEFVPAGLGGRLGALEDLVAVLRTVYRRDPALGLGHGAGSLIAAVNVWTGAHDEQRRDVADLLLGGGRLACGYHELAHGNDIGRADLSALPRPGATDGSLVLDGRKEVVANLRRADATVLFARTDPDGGSRGFSQLLVRRDTLPPGRMRHLPRWSTAGMRGVELGGVEFDACPVPSSAVLGEPGRGLEVALTSFQVTRTALPAMMTGILDTGLRVALRHLTRRRLYGGAATDLSLVRAVLARAWTDLWACEAHAHVAGRALSLLPREASVHAAAVKVAVAHRLVGAMNALSGVLGSRFYVREGPHAIFQKLLRDVAPIGFGHAARAVCQLTLLGQLPLLARRSWSAPDAAPVALFRSGDDPGPVAFDRLRISAGGRDHVVPAVAGIAGEQDCAELAPVAARLRDELADLTRRCADLPAGETSATAGADSYDLAARYAELATAASVLGTWRHGRTDDPFLADPRWVRAVLHGVTDPDAPLPDDLVDPVFDELVRRHEQGLPLGFPGGTDRRDEE